MPAKTHKSKVRKEPRPVPKRKAPKSPKHHIEFVKTLDERGFIYQGTDLVGLEEAFKATHLVGYVGFDCTAPSLHVGSLVQIMLLRWLQKAGGRPIVLMGGGTTRIGDPSDKDSERPLLSAATITSYKRKIKTVFDRFLEFGEGPTDAVMEDNSHWLGEIRYLKFLRDVGRHFTINRMLTLESVRRRLDREQPLTFMEFNYPLLQAADFLTLNKRYNCQLQMGGSDQWGNIVQGVELCRRVSGVECFGLTSPLITTASGAKMGKTADGAVWLSAQYRSPFEYWQFWRNTEDADVERFLKLFTELPLDEVQRLGKLRGAEINDAKRMLATEATTLLHGREEATKAERAAKATFEDGSLSADLPSFPISRSELNSGTVRMVHAFVRTNLLTSNGEAKRQIAAGTLRANDEVISDELAVLSSANVVNGVIKLSFGRKKHALLRVN